MAFGSGLLACVFGIIIVSIVFGIQHFWSKMTKTRPDATVKRSVVMPIRKKVEFRDGCYRNIDTFARVATICDVVKRFHVIIHNNKYNTTEYGYQQIVYLQAFHEKVADYLEDTLSGLDFIFRKNKFYKPSYQILENKIRSLILTLRHKAGIKQKQSDVLEFTEGIIAVFEALEVFYVGFLDFEDFDSQSQNLIFCGVNSIHRDIASAKFWKHLIENGLQSQPVLVTGNISHLKHLLLLIATPVSMLKFYGAASY